MKNEKNTTASIAAALTGLVVGTAGITLLLLSDDDTRALAAKKTKKMVIQLRKWWESSEQEMQTEDAVMHAVTVAKGETEEDGINKAA